ncbi:MAG: hypothetical protein AB8B59_14710, partial [Maribacter sp.]
MRALFVCLFVIFISCVPNSKTQYIDKERKEPSLQQVLDSIQLEKEDLGILIDKSDYKLYVL